MSRVVVVGGGISGLATAYRLRQAGRQVVLLESAPHLGGKARTERREGYLLEQGPNGWLADRSEVTQLAEELGLRERIIRPSGAYEKRFIVLDTARGLLPVPMKPPQIIKTPLLSFWGKLRLLCEPLIRRKRGSDEESIAAFGRRRIGREATAHLLDAIQTGIYAGDVEKLSIEACFPSIAALERQHGSLFRGVLAGRKKARPDRSLLSFPEGMIELTKALSASLGDLARTRQQVRSLRRQNGAWRLSVQGQAAHYELDASEVVLTTPGRAQAELLAPLDSALADEIRAIEYAGLSVLTLGYRREDVGHPLDGFGFLCPAVAQLKTLGVIFSSSVFAERAPEGRVILRCLIGGARDPEHNQRSDEEVISDSKAEVEALLQISGQPELVSLARHAEAIPQYNLGHLDRVSRIEARRQQHPGLILSGNLYRGVAVYDCVSEAARIAQSLRA
jgi:oxygen-dependent protoporphyrinogen oxidase